MPPKKQQKANTKTDQKKKDKVIEDKTFGLKNKKGNKQQKFIKNVTQQVKYGGSPSARKQELLKEEERKKKEKKGADDLDIFRPVMAQNKVGKGADPKSVLCAFFKQGMCQKGAKCKFSHDLTIERKSEKRSLYFDARDDEREGDNMDNWDEDKLKEVVEKKHGANNQTKTEKVCKFFLQAIEDKKYGWFWICPNGGDACMYRHALPPGFILKSEQKKMEDQKEKISIEDLIEKERAALGSNVTKITLATFLVWKKKKRQEKIKELEASKEKRKNDFKTGTHASISGREMFEFRPDMVNEDNDDEEGATYASSVREVDDVTETIKELSLNTFTPTDNVGDTGGGETASNSKSDVLTNGIKLSGATAPPSTEETNVAAENVPVDEDLFTEDLDDLDDIDDLE